MSWFFKDGLGREEEGNGCQRVVCERIFLNVQGGEEEGNVSQQEILE